MDGQVKALRAESLGQQDARFRWEAHIENTLARVAIKMTMLLHVRTKPGGSALDGHLAGQTAFDQRVQAVIHRGHRDVGHFALSSNEHFLGGRVVAFIEQHAVDVLALRSKSKPTRRQLLAETLIVRVMFRCVHNRHRKIPYCGHLSIFGIILR